MEQGTDSGLVVRPTTLSHAATVAHLVTAIDAHGATLFDVIDHAENAAQVGLDLPPASVVIFGNPAVGTPLMVTEPNLALDLPSRVLVRRAESGQVEVVYRAPAALARGHGLPEESAAGLAGLIRIVDDALDQPGGQGQAGG